MSLFRLLGFSISNHSSHLGDSNIRRGTPSKDYLKYWEFLLLGNTQRLSRSAFPTGFPYIKRCLKERLVCRMLKDLQGQQEAKEPAIDDSALSDMLVGVIRARNKAALDGLKLLFPCS